MGHHEISMNVILLRSICAISAFVLAANASAQEADESALDTLDQVPRAQMIQEPEGASQLRAAIKRISYNSSDADALADAGNASLTLGDANAALNFFTRANALRPGNGKIVAGLATATVRTENPFEALRLFDDAVRLGIAERAVAADRALAFDLLGNFDRAQQDYRLARSASSSDDVLIRHAISLSLSGKKTESDAMLIPLLQKNSPAAWRARAFMLASRGDFRESTKVTQGFMNPASAQRMERYLRLMPDLTGAQQAAAIHLGHFPASQYVGQDSAQVRRVASTISQAPPSTGESRLIPSGAPLGTKIAGGATAKPVKRQESRDERRAREREEVRIAAAQIPDSRKLPKTDRSRLGTETAQARVAEAQAAGIKPANTGELPPPEAARAPVTINLPPRSEPAFPAQPQNAQPPATQAQAASLPLPSSPPPTSQMMTQAVTSAPVISGSATTRVATASDVTPTPVFSPASSVGGSTLTPPIAALQVAPTASLQGPMPDGAAIAAVAPVPVVVAPAFDLASVVGSIQIPESEQTPSAVPVDLKKIKATAEKSVVVDATSKNLKVDAKAPAKGKMEATHPARFWVQIATGEASALGYDYRKWTKKTPDLFKSQNGWTSAWGKTSRLLVGPFADMKIAKKWEADFKKAGGDGFMWKSENGVVVTTMKTK